MLRDQSLKDRLLRSCNGALHFEMPLPIRGTPLLSDTGRVSVCGSCGSAVFRSDQPRLEVQD